MLLPLLLFRLYISHSIITRGDYLLTDFILILYFYVFTTLEQPCGFYLKEEDLI